MAAAAKKYDAADASGSTSKRGRPGSAAGATVKPSTSTPKAAITDVVSSTYGPRHELGRELDRQPVAHERGGHEQPGEELARDVAGQGDGARRRARRAR